MLANPPRHRARAEGGGRRPAALPAARAPLRDAAHVRGAGAAGRARARRRRRAPPAHPQDRVHVRERRGAGGGARLQDVHQPAHHDPGRPRAGRAAPDRPGPVEQAEAEERVEALAAGLREALPGRIYSEDGRELHEVVAALLRERSLDGWPWPSRARAGCSSRAPHRGAGLQRLPRPRASSPTATASKVELLGVDAALIEAHGAVSEQTARAMAAGARRSARPDVAVAITGIAGPDGGTAEKPVGLVFIALDGRGGHARAAPPLPGQPRAHAPPGLPGRAGDDRAAACSASAAL